MRRLSTRATTTCLRWSSTSAPAAAGAPKPPSKVPTTSDKADASFVGDDVPFSTVSHQLTKLVQARRLVLPTVTGLAAWTMMPVAATALHWCALGTVTAMVQRLSVRGASNSLRPDLTGRVAVVTGGTSGIGLSTVVELLEMNASVCIVSRSGKMEATKAHLVANTKIPPDVLAQRVSFVETDFMDLQQVSIAAKKVVHLFPKIDFLVNNAAVFTEDPRLSKQNIEEHVAVNFVAPVLFTEVLLPALRKSVEGARIVNVTCSSHVGVRKGNIVNKRLLIKPTPDEGQVTARCYTASKLGNIYHAQALAGRRYEGIQFDSKATKGEAPRPFSACTADPGVVNSPLDRTDRLLGNSALANAVRSLWMKDTTEGAQTVVNCLVRPDLENGGHYVECRLMPSALSRMAMSVKEQQEVYRWAMSKTEKFL